jgi:putative nucleotidyltransferase with HDIG domain
MVADNRGIPDYGECLALLEESLYADESIASHCVKVAKTALLICVLLRNNAPTLMNLNLDLVQAGALVHDIARKAPNHATRGAVILRGMGFPAVADIVASHMDIEVDVKAPINEREIVYFADKLTFNDRLCPNVEGRFKDKLIRFSNDPEAVEAIGRRLEAFSTIREKLSRVLEKDIIEALHDLSPETR